VGRLHPGLEAAGRRFPRADGLALAISVAAVVSLPVGIADAGVALLRPEALGAGLVVALLCSAVPYTLELLALRRLRAGAFGVLLSLSPAVAALAGFIVLDQQLAPVQMVAIGLVVVASTGAVRTGRPDRVPRHGGVGTLVRREADR
jgi:inner membrane transporter RhtA